LFHQKTETATWVLPNRKFISSDWHSEVVYNSNGMRIENIEDIGTYNFFDPINESLLHTKYDVKSYRIWWN
jgi:hypothetical protein